MMGMQLSLQTLLPWLSGAVLQGDGAVQVQRVHTDTRTLRIGDLFVALRGERFDGAQFIAQAKAMGAVAVLCEASGRDAAQAVGKVPVDVRALGVSLLSIAGHKLYAPKGVGALFVAEGVPLEPVLVGAGHERGIRPGTENVAAIAALGEACALALEDLEHEAARQRTLRDALVEGLAASGFIVHGARAERLPNTVNGRFPGVLGAALQEAATALAFSTASACHAGQASPSKVLLAMGLTPTEALGAVRLSLGRATTFHDVRDAAASLRTAAEALSSARNSHATVDR